MKTITENVKNAFKQPTTQRKGRILVNGNYYDVYNVEYYADCYDEGKVIGNAIASQLDFDIPYMPKFDTFKYFDGIKVGNDYEYIDLGNFTVFDEQDQDEFNKHITAFDNLIKFNKPFESRGAYPKTLYEELCNVCEQAEVQLINDSIPNGSFIVENNQFVDGESLKTVLKQICSISGTYAISKINALKLQLTNPTNEIIDKSQHEPVDWKRRSYGINQVILGNSQIEGEYVIKQDDEDIALNGIHKLEILDNLFANTQAKRSALINELYNQVHGFGYIPFETKGEWLSYLEIGDTINIDGINTILLRVNGKSPQALETIMSAPAIIDSSIEYVDNTADVDNRLKLTERTVDKQNQIITDVVSNVTEQNNKISQITQTVDEINAKISDIADVTVSAEDTDGQVELENINESEPIQIKIRPIGENIGYDYPHNDYPQNDYSKIRTLMFTRTYQEDGVTKTQNIPYELPDDLLYYDEETFDEFYLDYDSETCQITKRCQYDNDGSVIPLANEQIVPYEYPTINLGSGDYTVCLLGYSTAYLMVRLMVSNIYTTQFATKVEMHSAISQTAQEINIEVGTKVGKDETIASINLSPETATIQANKINIAGTISAINNNTTTTINGDKITTGSITTDQIAAGAITASKVSSDIITTTNFSAQNINADKITGGTLSGASINVGTTNYYLRMGANWTRHPEVSGLNVTGGGGIALNGNGISGCTSIGVNTIGTYSTGEVYINTATRINGALYYLGWDGNYHQLAGLYSWFQSGGSDYIDVRDADGRTNLRLHFENGLYTGYTRL